MKKILALILCLGMAFSMAACEELEALKNVKLPAPPSASNKEEAAEPSAPTERVEEKSVEAPAPADEKAEELVIVKNEKTLIQDYDPAEGTQLILTFSYDTPKVYIDGRDEATSKINEYIGLMDESYYTGPNGSEYDAATTGGYNMMLQIAQDNFTYCYENNIEDMPLELSSVRGYSVERADGNVLSIVFHISSYTGGAHGNYKDYACSFDTLTGNKLALPDVSADYDSLADFLIEYMNNAVNNSEKYKEQLKDIAPEEQSKAIQALLRDGSWYFDNNGLVIFSDNQELGSYADGNISFTIPYAELEGKIDDKFIPSARTGNGEFHLKAMKDVQDGSVKLIDKLNILPKGGAGEELCLSASGNVYDVELVSVSYTDKFYELDTLWYANEMGDSALQLLTSIPDGIPNLMLKYRIADGTEVHKLISQSGKDGSYLLIDDDIEAVG